jgi:hypothetical protein
MGRYNASPTGQSVDARAIASDFIVTGNDMRAALADMPENKLPAGRSGGLVHQTQTQTIYQGPLPTPRRHSKSTIASCPVLPTAS